MLELLRAEAWLVGLLVDRVEPVGPWQGGRSARDRAIFRLAVVTQTRYFRPVLLPAADQASSSRCGQH